ncbi:hypothetical protein AB7W88_12125 [Providencia vermicola]|uniref:DUF3899 domain-containing protein n=3 Tax=Providencia TaxID=586 RepID=A0AAI9I1R4_PROST|nr:MULTISPECIES: hypothetical protein [Providencia]ELR5044330.1 hypothetical protein [Providencia rettgeri]MTB39834.1 hypothetical protein [Providencia sp. wls1949]MTC08187.1 hypothetical protein [Providencia sp. wls1948]ELR5037037.1 hypothetical protein [Providencia stuartii]ELR5120100.1 hypothetical protein [Providencia stuartii]
MSHLSNKQCGDVMIIFTASWRYLCCASLLAFICQLILFIDSFTQHLYFFLGTVFFIISHYYIFRLSLDNHLFKVLYQTPDAHHFDLALQFLFKKNQHALSMEQRWIGTKKLFNYALVFVISAWGWLLISILMTNQ